MGAIFSLLFRGAAVGFTAGFLMATLALSWVWLEMRVNVGLVIPIAALLCAMFALWKGYRFPYRLFLFLQCLLIALFLFRYGFDGFALRTVAASLFREGFLWKGLPLETAALLVGGVFFSGNIFWRWPLFAHPAPQFGGEDEGSPPGSSRG